MGSGSSKHAKTRTKAKETDKRNKTDTETVKEPENDTKTSEDCYEEVVRARDHVDDHGEDDWSINSEDTLCLVYRTEHFVPKEDDRDSDDTDNEKVETDIVYDNELIEVIAMENLDAYDSAGHFASPVNSSNVEDNQHDRQIESSDKDNEESSNEMTQVLTAEDPEAFEVGTIGYYIAIANNDAKSINENNHQKERHIEKSDIWNFLNEISNDDHFAPSEEKQTNSEPKLFKRNYEACKKIYGGNTNTQPKKMTISNRQTLILVRVGKKLKYTAVPAYLCAQKTYKANSVKKYKLRKAYKLSSTKGSASLKA